MEICLNNYVINNDKNTAFCKTESSVNLRQNDKSYNHQISNDNGYNEEIKTLLNEVNSKFKIFNKELSYSIHEKTNRYIVTIKDSETGNVIKEVPSEESLDLFAKVMEMSGLIFDEKS